MRLKPDTALGVGILQRQQKPLQRPQFRIASQKPHCALVHHILEARVKPLQFFAAFAYRTDHLLKGLPQFREF